MISRKKILNSNADQWIFSQFRRFYKLEYEKLRIGIIFKKTREILYTYEGNAANFWHGLSDPWTIWKV